MKNALRSTLAAAVLLIPTACSRPLSLPRATKTIEYSVVAASPPVGPTVRVSFHRFADKPGATLELEAPVQVGRIQSVKIQPDDLGFPGVYFELDERDAAKFREYTASHVHEQLAILVEGGVACHATINEALPGVCFVSGRYTEEQAQYIKRVLE